MEYVIEEPLFGINLNGCRWFDAAIMVEDVSGCLQRGPKATSFQREDEEQGLWEKKKQRLS